MGHDVFISYSSKDKPIADAICANLEAAGIRCWIAPRDIAPGEDWPAAISRAISQTHIMVLVFSAFSNSSEDVSRELILAANSKLVIIPFKIENIEPEPGKQYYLARTHWLDAINPPTTEQIQELVNRVKMLVPPREPGFIENQTGTALPPGATVPGGQSRRPAYVLPPYSTSKVATNGRPISRWFWLIPVGVILLGLLGWAASSLFFKHPTATIQPSPFPAITPSLMATTIPTQNPTPTATPALVPVVLYSDDFSNDQSGWRQSKDAGGQVGYSGGQYSVRLTKGDQAGWSCANRIFPDAVLTVDAILVSGSATQTGSFIIWRFVDSQNFYVLHSYGDGNLRIDKLLNGEWKALFGPAFNSGLNKGQQMNKIAISFSGQTSAIYINDRLVTSIKDPSFTAGDFCLGAASDQMNDAEVSYDNLVIYTIDSWAPPN
jgi:hypothetical protein